VSLTYIAYSSFDLQSANSIQTFLTCQSLARIAPRVRVILPKSPRRRAEARGVPVTFVNKLPLRWVLGERGERFERRLFAARAAVLARRLAAPVYTRDTVVAVRCAAAGLAVGVEVHDLEEAAGAIARADCVVVLNETLAQRLRGDSRCRRVEVIPDAFDSAVFHPRPRIAARAALGLPHDAFAIGYAGLTFAGRGVDLLLAAFDRLDGAANPRLLLLGGAFGEVERLKLAGRPEIVAPGRLAPEKVAQWLAAADVLVIPDVVGGAAASPLKMFEYAALEIPIVAPERGEIRSVLGDDACYFAARDAQALAGALRDVAQNAESWRTRAQRLRQALSGFDYAERARRILRVMTRAAR
jgi:glycosyltransferase involved in cell wall biosynthesis